MIEVERKYRVANVQKYITILERLGATLEARTKQHDQVFLPSGIASFRDYKKGMPIVRIRIEDEAATLTLKAGGDTHFTHESETAISDPEMARQIITALSMHEVLEIIKSRTSYRHSSLTIACDRVDHLGDFIEVELLVAKDGEVAGAIKRIDDFASSKLGLNQSAIESERYDVLIEKAKLKG